MLVEEEEELGSSTSDAPMPEVTVVAMLCVEEVVGLLSTHALPPASSIGLEWWGLLLLLLPTVISIVLLLVQTGWGGNKGEEGDVGWGRRAMWQSIDWG